MKEIDAYLDALYKNVKGTAEEIGELKLEMKTHLLDSVKELQDEGKSEEESVRIAIGRFGDVSQINKELPQVLSVPDRISQKIIRTAVNFLITGVIILGLALVINGYKQVNQMVMVNRIFELMGQDPDLSMSTRNRLSSTIEKYRDVLKLNYVAVFPPSGRPASSPDVYLQNFNQALYIYPATVGEREVVTKNGAQSITSHSESRSDISSLRLEWQNRGQIPDPWTIGVFLGIFLVFFSVYWVLFAIWASLMAYRCGNLTTGWLLVFALLNWPGYLLFQRNKKRINRRQGRLTEME